MNFDLNSLQTELQSPDENRRMWVIGELGRQAATEPAAIALLNQARDLDPSPVVRQAAADELNRLRPQSRPRSRRPLLIGIGAVLLLTLALLAVWFLRSRLNTIAEIDTPLGAFTIKNTEYKEYFPEWCEDESINCSKAASGERFLYIWIEPQDENADLERIFFDMPQDIRITSGDGEEILLAGSREDIENFRIGLVYEVDEDASDFTLYWPDQAPIELDK